MIMHIGAVLQACSVNMAGYWPRPFYVFSMNTQKRSRPNKFVEEKDLLYGIQNTTMAGYSGRFVRHIAGFDLSCPRAVSQIISVSR